MTKTNALRLLDKAGLSYRVVSYTYDAAQLDVEKIAIDNELELGQIFKTLVCKGDKTGPIVAIVPGGSQLNLKQIAKVSGNKKITMLPLAKLTNVTGYVRGGCSPIGMEKDFPVFIDESAVEWQEVLINAGSRGVLFGCSANELVDTFGFQWAKII